jgi:hypothetical protein
LTDRLEIGLEGTHAVGAHHAADVILQLGHELPCDREHLATAVGGPDELGARIGRIRYPGHVAVGLEVVHELGHGLLGHLRASTLTVVPVSSRYWETALWAERTAECPRSTCTQQRS